MFQGACQYVLLQASKAIFDLDGETDVDGIDLIRKTWGEVRTNTGPLTGENVFYGIGCDLLLELWPCGGLWIPRPNISDFSQSFIVVSGAGRVFRPIKDLHGRMNEAIDGLVPRETVVKGIIGGELFFERRIEKQTQELGI
ncbi:hypothetical protein PENSUB_9432 [Penicillium subrubescens]|uniref:Uncharacterized protein n=1 Tax=Penicillium subrubescens TaxID=1316194 RepID=A0A1Q5TDN7_9EURO|nr:hypothetical protein PENSUB_9432 [Penicillium subrubescens]